MEAMEKVVVAEAEVVAVAPREVLEAMAATEAEAGMAGSVAVRVKTRAMEATVALVRASVGAVLEVAVEGT